MKMIMILGFMSVTFLGLWMVLMTKSIEWLKERVDKLEKLIDTDDEVEERPLEQDQFINKPCVSTGVCEHDKNVVLDKIRAEIDKIYEREGSSFDCLNALDELKEFIDKLKAESEE